MGQWETVQKRLKALWEDKRSYQARLWLSGAVMLAFAFTYLFFGPLELVAFSGGSLSFTYKDVFWLLLGTMAVFVLVTTPLLALLRGRIFNYSICVAATIVIAGYVQALAFNSGLGLLTGDGIDWSAHAASAVWGLLFWAAVLVALLFGNAMMLLYSIAGAFLSLLVMYLLKLTKLFSMVGVSIAGGVFHNAGQIIVAAIVLETAEIGFYMPVLAISGTLAGIAVGLITALVIKKLNVLKF